MYAQVIQFLGNLPRYVASIQAKAAPLLELAREYLEENEKAALFGYEEDKMYSQKESELIQRYLQE